MPVKAITGLGAPDTPSIAPEINDTKNATRPFYGRIFLLAWPPLQEDIVKKCQLIIALPLLATLAACSARETKQMAKDDMPAPENGRAMDEVPAQETLPNGNRQFSYANGCVIVLEPKRAVVTTQAPNCQPHHRDISLLYASGD